MTLAVDINDLYKTYRANDKSVNALSGVSLQVKSGDFFGLLGLNGAGKTTLINIMVGLVRPSEGHVNIMGHDVVKDPYGAKRLVGIMPQEININIFNTVKEVLFNHGGYYGLTRDEILGCYKDILHDVGLAKQETSAVHTLSGGMKRRLLLARALMVQPKLLILDEPTAGVDVELRKEVWDLLLKLNKQGTTIVLTTHYMEEAEYLCKNLAILHHGKIIDQGQKSALSLSDQARHLVLHLQSEIDEVYEQDLIEVAQQDARTLSLNIQPGADLAGYLQKIEASGGKVGYVSSPSSRLEQYFRSQTDKSISS